MLHFNTMTLCNFGPYKGEQIIDFTQKPGVTIFWGDNGRGKTTLLNAFRYALFGVVQRRNGNLKDLSEMENTEAKADGKMGFSVKLAMTNDENDYELTRSYEQVTDNNGQSAERYYVENFFLKKNGSILSPDERDHELNIIMPEQISRFFLFDAELLQEYEELLEIDSSTGDRIKKSIEKILGMPVLQNGVIDIAEAESEYEKLMAAAARKDDKTVQFGQKLEEISRNIEQHKNIINTKNSELASMIKERNTLDNKMNETAKYRDWLAQRKSAQSNLQKYEKELDDIYKNLQENTKSAWKDMLSTTIRDLREKTVNNITDLEAKKQKRNVAEKFIIEMKKAIADRTCPVCGQEISPQIIDELENKINASSSEYTGLTEAEREQLYCLQKQRSEIEELDTPNVKNVIKVLEENADKTKINIGAEKQKIIELNEDIDRLGRSEGEDEIEQIVRQYSDIEASITIKRQGIDAENSKLDELKLNKEKLSESISKMAGGIDYKLANKRYGLCKEIFNIFNESKTRYREELKSKVEKDATNIFVQLRGDKDYIGLKINDNYGLSIVHRSGRLVPGRSSGYEHIVALSLIGALHKNAPLQGPIIMDSPFGRLDPTHKANIVRVLPSMAEQSMLLAYTGEIDPQTARLEIGYNLIKEYQLTRITSMHTEVQ